MIFIFTSVTQDTINFIGIAACRPPIIAYILLYLTHYCCSHLNSSNFRNNEKSVQDDVDTEEKNVKMENISESFNESGSR